MKTMSKISIQQMKKTKLLNSKSLYVWCIENNRQDVLDRWDYELNGCSPKEVCYGSGDKYYFKCLKHPEHKSELKKIDGITHGKYGVMNCKQCNSIAQYILDNFPDKDLYEVWDKEKNGDLNPWNIQKGSNTKIYIFCQEKDYHESYEVVGSNFTKGVRCPFCVGRKVHRIDSLGQYIIDNYGEDFLWKVWSEKNNKSPFEIAPYSNKKYWWICLDNKHEDYKRRSGSAIELEFRCPECVYEKEHSIIEEKTKLYLEELEYRVFTEYDCSIVLKNPKSGRSLPFDNEIILENGKHLIIEVHGSQHYYKVSRTSSFLKEGQTPEEYLHQRKLYDRYKRIKCIQAGYYYLELSYKTFDKKETYKNLIDNKIKEILES